MAAFAAVARAGSFTKAAAQLSVTQSALSQTVKALEARLGAKLLNRTTRSVATTEAGERLFRAVDATFADIDAELAAVRGASGKPAGSVRITATEHAVRTLIWPKLKAWLPRYPDIKVEISSDNRFADIVSERFDIGVRLGGDVAKDMIAVRIAPDMRMAVVGSPAYFASHPHPQSPQDLADHDCIGLRLPTHGGMLPWEFKQGDRTASVRVGGRLTFNQSALMADAALAGHGLAWLPGDLVAKDIAAGKLVPTLEDQAIDFPGYHLYYASRRASPALALVVDALRLRAKG